METHFFDYLISPLLKNDFFSNYWEKKFLHVIRNKENYYKDYLSVAAVDDFLSQQIIMPQGIRLVNQGGDIHSTGWIKRDTVGDGRERESVDTEKVFRFFNEGATIIIPSAQKTMPRIADACRLFEQEMKMRVTANIYVTPSNSQGFAMHYDDHDIFAMQLKGPKTWKIYDSGEALPTNIQPFRMKPELVSTIEINSGDLLYLPRGTVHEAFASEASAIHVNFSCMPRYGFHLIKQLSELAEEQDVFFRRVIPHGFSKNEEVQGYVNLFVQKLQELLLKNTPDILLTKQTEHFAKLQLLDFHEYLNNSIALEKLNADSVVSVRHGFVYALKEAKEGILISFGQQELMIPRVVEKEIFFLDEPFKVKEIRGMLTPSGKLKLVRELVLGGFLKINQL